jgi:cation diffusion facilitator family transporter
VDGFTSLAVFVGALLVLAGFPLADPIVGLLITVAILLIVRGTGVQMWRRLLDGVDPQITADIEAAALRVAAVHAVGDVRARWVGHRLHAELTVVVDGELPTRVSHQIGEDVRESLGRALPHLATTTIHVDPFAHGGQQPDPTPSHPTPPDATGHALGDDHHHPGISRATLDDHRLRHPLLRRLPPG